MDFNTIYELVAPYLGTTGIAGIIIAVLTLYVKGSKILSKGDKAIGNFIKDLQARWDTSENEMLKAFKSALPSDIFINIESIARKELSAISGDILGAINEKIFDQIKNNTELMKAIAKALLDNKTIPDSDKNAIAELLDINNSNTTKGLKVELLPIEEKVEETVPAKILID